MAILNPTMDFSLNIKGHLQHYSQPVIMGILNLTPDSFYDGGQNLTKSDIVKRVEKMIREGAGMIDIGAMSSRPYSNELPEEEELNRVSDILPMICREFPDTIFSMDTYRSRVAEFALDHGVSIINDITAGLKDPNILTIARKFNAPYIAMHMQGNPETMQHNPQYKSLLSEIYRFFSERLLEINKVGISDIILDVGFGFGKSLSDNYQLLHQLSYFQNLRKPLLVGISRKSMVYNVLKTSPNHALNGTTALHFEALRNGANILRVHDVKEAKEVVELFNAYRSANS